MALFVSDKALCYHNILCSYKSHYRKDIAIRSLSHAYHLIAFCWSLLEMVHPKLGRWQLEILSRSSHNICPEFAGLPLGMCAARGRASSAVSPT